MSPQPHSLRDAARNSGPDFRTGKRRIPALTMRIPKILLLRAALAPVPASVNCGAIPPSTGDSGTATFRAYILHDRMRGILRLRFLCRSLEFRIIAELISHQSA